LPFYHPTTVALVSEDSSLVVESACRLDEEYALLRFDSALHALDEIARGRLETETPIDFFTDYTGRVGHPTLERVIGIDLSWTIQRIYDAHRFSVVSVIVVDLEMPNVDGLDLCRQIKALPCRKILLAPEGADTKIVRAFNLKLIDAVVMKCQPDLVENLGLWIARLQHEFLELQMGALRLNLSLGSSECWADPAFDEFFYQIRRSCQAIEYYSVADPNGFLLLDRAGRTKFLALLTERELDQQAAWARQAGAPKSLVTDLETGEAMLVFRAEPESRSGAPEEWWNARCPVRVFPGRVRYYYAVIDGAEFLLGGGRFPIMSYGEYLRQHQGMTNAAPSRLAPLPEMSDQRQTARLAPCADRTQGP
jgi:CheY-like chemotaxis protein